MRISGSGMAKTGMRAIRERKELHHAKAAISCLHDALLAVALGKITPAQVQDFFWRLDIETAKMFGDVIDLSDDGPANPVTGEPS